MRGRPRIADDKIGKWAMQTHSAGHGTVGEMPLLIANPKEITIDGKKKSSRSAGSSASDGKRQRVIASAGNDGSVTVIIVTPDGRLCKVCKLKDTTLDYLDNKIPIKWAKPPKKHGDIYLNDGRILI